MQAIKAMPGPTILIVGGYDKHSEFDEWIESFDGKVRYLVLIGQTRDKIAVQTPWIYGYHVCGRSAGSSPGMCILCKSEAIMYSFSPASASWGQFKTLRSGGTKFKEYVRPVTIYLLFYSCFVGGEKGRLYDFFHRLGLP